MTINYAEYQQKSAPLGADFAKEFVARQFGPEAAEAIYKALPLYQRGPRKGQVKGWILWKKCTKGGWVKTGRYDEMAMRATGYVMGRGSHQVEITLENPMFPSSERRATLEASDRRGAETAQEWAARCEWCITKMKEALKK